MKKIGILIISFIMLISAVAACGNNATEPAASTDGLSGQINVYSRDTASGTRDGFESVVGFKDQLTDRANEVASNGEMATQKCLLLLMFL